MKFKSISIEQSQHDEKAGFCGRFIRCWRLQPGDQLELPASTRALLNGAA